MRIRIGRLTILVLCAVLSACAGKSRQSGSGALAPPPPAPQQQATQPAKPPVQVTTPRAEPKASEPALASQPGNEMMHYPEQADDPWSQQADEPFQPLTPPEDADEPEVAQQGQPASGMVDYAKKDEFHASSTEEAAAENDWEAAFAPSDINDLQAAFPEYEHPVQEAISNPVVHNDYEEDGVLPPENILPPTLFGDHEEDGVLAQEAISNPVVISEHGHDGVAQEDLITEHRVFHDDSGVTAHEDAIGAPHHFAEETEESAPQLQASLPEPQPQTAYVSPYDAAAPFEEVIDAVVEDRSYAAFVEAQNAHAGAPVPRDESPILVAQAAPVAERERAVEPKSVQPKSVQPSRSAAEAPTHIAALAPSANKPPLPTANLPVPTAPDTEEHLMTVVLSADALFDFGKHKLRPAGKKGLDDFVAGLRDVQWGEIKIVGHSDRLGNAKFNKRLSERRAQAVKAYLVSKKISGKKIKTAGKGKAQPITAQCEGTKSNPQLIACLQADRRVEIFVDEKREVKKVVKVTKPKKASKVSRAGKAGSKAN
ncbi:MAG: OmpA family protein [Burkholderiales bacterium]